MKPEAGPKGPKTRTARKGSEPEIAKINIVLRVQEFNSPDGETFYYASLTNDPSLAVISLHSRNEAARCLLAALREKLNPSIGLPEPVLSSLESANDSNLIN